MSAHPPLLAIDDLSGSLKLRWARMLGLSRWAAFSAASRTSHSLPPASGPSL